MNQCLSALKYYIKCNGNEKQIASHLGSPCGNHQEYPRKNVILFIFLGLIYETDKKQNRVIL